MTHMMKKVSIAIMVAVFVATMSLSMVILPSKVHADSATYAIGDTGPAGGYIFYDKGYDSDGWRYLEANYVYQINYTWHNNYILIGGTGTAIGTGKANTAAIILDLTDTGNYAAKYCADYTRLYNGVLYDDWFLPSKDEFHMLYENLKNIYAMFTYASYWTSSEFDSGHALG